MAEQEIVVTGRRLPPELWYSSGGGGGSGTSGGRGLDAPALFYAFDMGTGGGGGGSPEDSPWQTPPLLESDVAAPPGSDLATALGQFELTINNVHDRMIRKPYVTFSTNDGKTIDFSEIYHKWIVFNFKITGPNVTYPPKFGGGVSDVRDANGNVVGYRSSMKESTVVGYWKYGQYDFQKGQEAFNFLAMHEVVHTTVESTNFYNARFQEYVARTGEQSGENFGYSPEFRSAENYVNYIVRQLAQHLELPVMPNPPYGYD